MLTVAILINGHPIMARSAHRIKDGVYKVDDGSIVTHSSKDGAVVLAHKLLDTIREGESGRGEGSMRKTATTARSPKPDMTAWEAGGKVDQVTPAAANPETGGSAEARKKDHMAGVNDYPGEVGTAPFNPSKKQGRRKA